MLRNACRGADSDGCFQVATADLAGESHSMQRFLLWIDGVGGYLVCPGDVVRIGRAGSAGVDVPLVADIAQHHAEIRRDGEGYLLETYAATWLEGRPVQQALMSDRCRLRLGKHVILRFVRSTPLSLSARLDFESAHRTHPTTDGVLLMAHNLILGNSPTAHVRCRDWGHTVILFRQGEELWCRAGCPFRVDGVPQGRVGKLTLSSLVEGADFALRLEGFPSAKC